MFGAPSTREARPAVVCLTPVRNEAWILERFLRCASLWADHIVVADEGSDDASADIARRFPRVRLIANRAAAFDEAARQRLLLAAARQIAGPRLLLALDADELLTAGAWSTAEWSAMLGAAPGTTFRFRWHNLRPGLASCWPGTRGGLWGFMDDGSPHAGTVLHSRRLPAPAGGAIVELDTIAVLHYQYTDWRRMQSKQRWYQCLERLLRPERGALEVYRQYHHMDAVPRAALRPVRREWFAGYEERGIDVTSVHGGGPYWFDREVVAMIDRHGARHFSRQAIWDADWPALAAHFGCGPGERFADPRSRRQRAVHAWLRLTQRSRERRPVQRVDGWLRRRGW
jgi:glycosyltransferase involved in cell wall biosynthesis